MLRAAIFFRTAANRRAHLRVAKRDVAASPTLARRASVLIAGLLANQQGCYRLSILKHFGLGKNQQRKDFLVGNLVGLLFNFETVSLPPIEPCFGTK